MPLLTNLLVSAYCACGHYPQCPSGTLTSSGNIPRPRHTIAISRDLKSILPPGTKLAGVNLNISGTVEDTMNKRWKRKIDIFCGTNHALAMQIGIHSNITVKYSRP